MSLEIMVLMLIFRPSYCQCDIGPRYDSVTKSLLMMELALLTRCLSTTLNHGTNGWKLEIFKLGDLTMLPCPLDLSSCPAYQVEVLTDTMMIVTRLILTVVHQCNKIYMVKSMILLINIR